VNSIVSHSPSPGSQVAPTVDVAATTRADAGTLAAAVAAVDEGVLVCDAHGFVTLANPAVERILNRPPPATFDELLDDFDLPPQAGVARHPGRGDLRQRRSNRWIEVHRSDVAAARTSTGPASTGGFVVVLRDVSRAHEARDERDAFLGILSHELRTPITTIYVGSRLLAREEDAPPARRSIAADIEAEAERLFRLVEDLLVVTHSERGALEMVHEPVLLQRLVETAVRFERERSPGAEFVTSVADDLPPVDADTRHVVHVVRNLLVNAAAHSPDDGRIDVTLAGEHDGVAARVVDRRTSTEASEPKAASERGEPLTALTAGDGISLLVCDRLVRAMGGRIWIRRADGGGNEFGFWLPRFVDA